MNFLEQLFPKARGEIFRLLFANPGTALHLRELVRQSGLALGSIQSELSKLRAAGLLEAIRDGNRLYFRANTIHPIFHELRGIAQKATGNSPKVQEPPIAWSPVSDGQSEEEPEVQKTELLPEVVTPSWEDVLNIDRF